MAAVQPAAAAKEICRSAQPAARNFCATHGTAFEERNRLQLTHAGVQECQCSGSRCSCMMECTGGGAAAWAWHHKVQGSGSS